MKNFVGTLFIVFAFLLVSSFFSSENNSRVLDQTTFDWFQDRNVLTEPTNIFDIAENLAAVGADFGSSFEPEFASDTYEQDDSEELPEITTQTQTTAQVRLPLNSGNESNQPAVNQDEQFEYYDVVAVVDGDTFRVSINGTVETLRLIGMDTPETVDPRRPVQCFGQEASDKAKELLTGRKVYLVPDSSQDVRDRYGRLLVYAYRDDGLFFNQYMIEQGYAYEYTYQTPYLFQSEFREAQRQARDNLRGLWSPSTCDGGDFDSASLEDIFYTSSHPGSRYYYPSYCSAWRNLSQMHLVSFESLDDLLRQYPRTLSPQC